MASLATIAVPFIVLLLLLPSLALSLPTKLIDQTCNTTTYYDFCLSSLASDPHSPAASDVRSLSTIAVGLAVNNATNTSAYAAILARASADPATRSLLATCAAKYDHAREALQASLGDLAAETYDYAFVQVSAAAEYPAVCRVLFRQQQKAKAYPAELERREVALVRLCTVALDIISLLE